jgi:hypothetical protein
MIFKKPCPINMLMEVGKGVVKPPPALAAMSPHFYKNKDFLITMLKLTPI